MVCIATFFGIPLTTISKIVPYFSVLSKFISHISLTVPRVENERVIRELKKVILFEIFDNKKLKKMV